MGIVSGRPYVAQVDEKTSRFTSLSTIALSKLIVPPTLLA